MYLNTLKYPAMLPRMKNMIRNSGDLSKYLSSPIPRSDPTAIAEKNSTPQDAIYENVIFFFFSML